MAQEKRKAYDKIITPRGTLIYPKLVEPDTFKGKTTYSTKIKLSGSSAAALVAQLTEAAEAHRAEVENQLSAEVAEAKGEKKVKAKKKLSDLQLHVPFKPEYDDEGNETGNVIFSAKMNASYKDQKTGKVVTINPAIVDRAGTDVTKKVKSIWGGTEAKVSASVVPTYVDATGHVGVTLRLRGVQVLKLVAGGNGAANDFGAEEGEFDASDLGEDTNDFSTESDGASPPAADEEEQF